MIKKKVLPILTIPSIKIVLQNFVIFSLNNSANLAVKIQVIEPKNVPLVPLRSHLIRETRTWIRD